MKEFGVEFEIEADKEVNDFLGIESNFMPFKNLMIGNLDSIGDLNLLVGNIYVVKESEEIFKLKKNDYFISNNPYDGEGNVFQSDSPEFEQKSCERLIMRDNKQFFMPEVAND